MSAPRVSVVIPCFNYAAYVADAVRSATTQTGVEVEVIVIDDASTDRSAEIVERISARDRRVTVVRQPSNSGPVATFNRGLDLASGEYLVRLDADDILTPGSLARSVSVARRFPEVGMVYGRAVPFVGDPPSRASTGVTAVAVWRGQTWLADRCRSGVNVITSPEVLMRTSVARSAGGQRELAHTHDMEMWLRLAMLADVAHIRGADQAWHRDHDRSLSCSAEHPLGLTMLEERRAAFEAALSGVDDAMLVVARRALAGEAVRRAAHEYDRRRAPGRSIEELVRFAVTTDPDVVRTAAWHGLEVRVAAGSSWTARRPWAVGLPFFRYLAWRAQHRRWRRTGVYSHLPPARLVRAGDLVLAGPGGTSSAAGPRGAVRSSGAR